MPSFPYSDKFDPPAPSCQLYLSATRRRRRVGPLSAMLDTGADGTLVPQKYLDEIGATRTFEMGLSSQWGERRVVYLYLVNLRIDEIELPGVFVVGDEQSNEVVIGRNVLNHLKIALDGPGRIAELKWE